MSDVSAMDEGKKLRYGARKRQCKWHWNQGSCYVRAVMIVERGIV